MSADKPPCWLTAYPAERQTFYTLLHATRNALIASGQLVKAEEFLARADEIPEERREDYSELLAVASEYVEIV